MIVETDVIVVKKVLSRIGAGAENIAISGVDAVRGAAGIVS